MVMARRFHCDAVLCDGRTLTERAGALGEPRASITSSIISPCLWRSASGLLAGRAEARHSALRRAARSARLSHPYPVHERRQLSADSNPPADATFNAVEQNLAAGRTGNNQKALGSVRNHLIQTVASPCARMACFYFDQMAWIPNAVDNYSSVKRKNGWFLLALRRSR